MKALEGTGKHLSGPVSAGALAVEISLRWLGELECDGYWLVLVWVPRAECTLSVGVLS